MSRLCALDDVIYELPRKLTKSFGSIASDFHKKGEEQGVGSWRDIDKQTLSANEILFIIVYQFWNEPPLPCGAVAPMEVVS